MALLSSSAFTSCDSHFEDLQENPNYPEKASPINLLQSIIQDSWSSPWTRAQRLNQYYVSTFVVYDDQNYLLGTGDNYYGDLRDVSAMEREANRLGSDQDKQFLPIAKFFRAFFYIQMTEQMGDIPMSEAEQGDNGNFAPKYDKQKDVYSNCLKLLDEANTEIAPYVGKESALTNDLYFNGDLSKWQKAINTFHVRVLMDLSKRNDEMDVAGKLKAIVSNPTKYPLMQSGDDNMEIRYYGNANDKYPLYERGVENTILFFIGETYLNLLRRAEDPRVFVQMTPGAAQNAGVEGREKMFSSYVGGVTGKAIATLQQEGNEGKLATMSNIYLTTTGLPCIQLGYPELQFTLAEAANRGWIDGDAETYYTNGIKADMAFYGIEAADVEKFLKNPYIAYKGNNADGLRQIREQKYVALFQNSGWQAFYEHRRTGVPEFSTGEGNANTDGKIPLRWMYPDDERQYNSEHLNEALKSQFNGSDDINDVMWLVK